MRTALTIAAAFAAGVLATVVGRWVRSRWTIVRRPTVDDKAETAKK